MSGKRDERNIERLTPIGDALTQAGLSPREHLPMIEPSVDRAHRLSSLPEPVKRVIHEQVGKALGVE